MLEILPFLAWLAAILSAVHLLVLWNIDELRQRSLVFLLGWFLLAAYCQFLGGSMILRAVGLLLQTLLAVTLVVRFRLSE